MLSCGATLQRLFVFFDAAKVWAFSNPAMAFLPFFAQNARFFDAHQKNNRFPEIPFCAAIFVYINRYRFRHSQTVRW